MAKILYRQMAAPRRAAQQIPAPQATAWMQSPRVETSFCCKSPGVRGGMFMDEIDTCITLPVPSLLVPTPDTGGGVGRTLLAISKTLGPMNLKFCRILETSLNVLKI